MRKHLILLASSILFNISVFAQNKSQKIVFDFVKSGTADFRLMVTQVNNILKEDPYTTIEVVCSGPSPIYAGN